MVQFPKYEGRLIVLNQEFPIYDREDDNKIIGYTEKSDMALINYVSDHDTYFETIIVSGKYIGVDTLALNDDDMKDAIFITNKIDGEHSVYIKEQKMKSEIR